MKQLLAVAVVLCFIFTAGLASANGLEVVNGDFDVDYPVPGYQEGPPVMEQDGVAFMGFVDSLSISDLELEFLGIDLSSFNMDFAAVSFGAMSQEMYAAICYDGYQGQGQGYHQSMSYETPNITFHMESSGFQYQYMEPWDYWSYN